MAQPSFSPIPRTGEVRSSFPTAIPEIGRLKKIGLDHSPIRPRGSGYGTPAPGEGYALTLAERAVAVLTFERPADHHDVVVGVALVAAKRASLVGRSPTPGDVAVALDHFALRRVSPVPRLTSKAFSGLAHSYSAQRRFVDAVPDSALLGREPTAAPQ